MLINQALMTHEGACLAACLPWTQPLLILNSRKLIDDNSRELFWNVKPPNNQNTKMPAKLKVAFWKLTKKSSAPSSVIKRILYYRVSSHISDRTLLEIQPDTCRCQGLNSALHFGKLRDSRLKRQWVGLEERTGGGMKNSKGMLVNLNNSFELPSLHSAWSPWTMHCFPCILISNMHPNIRVEAHQPHNVVVSPFQTTSIS